jgi:sugar lactone lactonase YvrE
MTLITSIALVKSGFVSLEAPVADGEGSLYVADLRAGGIYRVHSDGPSDVVVPQRPRVGGACLHAHGGLVVSGTSVAHVVDGESRTLLDLDDVPAREGKVAVAFNDLAADPVGRVVVGVLREDDAGGAVTGELIRIDAPHACEVLHDDLHPNGIAFSARDDVLFVADTFRRRLIVLDATTTVPTQVATISTESVPGLPDGIATDDAGGVWVAFYNGGCIARFGSGDSHASVFEIPSPKPLSLCFGAPDRSTLYVVTGRSAPGAADTGSVFRLTTTVQGVRAHVASI